MKNKWKRFAIGQVLSDHSSKVAPETLFDWILDTDDAGLCALFDDYDVLVWQPFEDWPLTDIASHITELATRAEETELEREA